MTCPACSCGVWNAYGVPSEPLEPDEPVRMVGFIAQPAGALTCLTQYCLFRFAPPVPVFGTTNSHRPVASEVHVGRPDTGVVSPTFV